MGRGANFGSVVKVLTRMRRFPAWAGVLVGMSLVIALAAIELVVGYEISFEVFFLFPVLLVTVSAGLRWGIAVALVSALTWAIVDHATGHTYSSAWIPLWNAAVRFSFFSVGVLLLDELVTAVGRLSELALRDALTGLQNTRSFYAQFEHEIARHRRAGNPLTVAYMDLDHFKEVNDTLGHAAGDDLLRATGTLLTGTLRESDLVARLGGDEFGILMPNTTAGGAEVALARVHSAVTARMIEAAPKVVGAGVTIGAVVFESLPDSPDRAVGIADSLMYKGKVSGRGTVRLGVWSHSGLAEQDAAPLPSTPAGPPEGAR